MKSSARPQLAGLSPGPNAKELLGASFEVVLYKIPLTVRFRGVTHREGLLLRGAAGWGECAPFWDYGAEESSTWLSSAMSVASTPFPKRVRELIPLNLTVPVVPVDQVLARIESQPGCSTAKVKVADGGVLNAQDIERTHVVAKTLADLYGTSARVRIDANAAWTVQEAADALAQLDEAAAPAGGLEYAEQPCNSVEELAELRTLTSVPIAADESIRRATDPEAVVRLNAADTAVLKVAPLGGVEAAVSLSRRLGLPPVVSSALDSSIGIAAGVALAATLPTLPYACGLNTGSLLAADVIDDPLVSREGATDPGFLSADRAAQVVTGELSAHSDPVETSLLELWRTRLEAMAQTLLAGEAKNSHD